MPRRITIDLVIRHASMDSLELEASVRSGPGDFVSCAPLPRDPTEDDYAVAARAALDYLVGAMLYAGWLVP